MAEQNIKKLVDDWVETYCLEHGRDDFPQYDDYVRHFASKYVEDYKEYLEMMEDDGLPPANFGGFLKNEVGVEPKDYEEYAQELREDVPFQLAEAHRDEFGW